MQAAYDAITRIAKQDRVLEGLQRYVLRVEDPLARGIVFAALGANRDARNIEWLRARLERTDRTAWLDEEMAHLTNPKTYQLDPETAWLRLKTRSGDPRHLAILCSLAAWRETEAQRRDVPRNRVLRDEQIFDISAHRPTSPEELARTRGLSRDLARGRIGQGILKALADGLNLPEADCPAPPPRIERA